VDLEKIKSIRGWLEPKIFSEIRSFMGLVGYYRRLIEGFSNVSHPITYLQKKGIKFEWTIKCEENFNLLKELLTSALVLKIVDPIENLLVCTDACKEVFRGVLTKNGYGISYEYINLKEHETNYEVIGFHSAHIEYVEALFNGEEI
jgi:hypothetical protein